MNKKVSFKFIQKSDDSLNNDKFQQGEVIFYQLATYPNKDGYHIRRFIINGDDTYKSVAVKYLSKDEYIKFIKENKQHKYKQYSTFDLNEVDYPLPSDISLARSDMLN